MHYFLAYTAILFLSQQISDFFSNVVAYNNKIKKINKKILNMHNYIHEINQMENFYNYELFNLNMLF